MGAFIFINLSPLEKMTCNFPSVECIIHLSIYDYEFLYFRDYEFSRDYEFRSKFAKTLFSELCEVTIRFRDVRKQGNIQPKIHSNVVSFGRMLSPAVRSGAFPLATVTRFIRIFVLRKMCEIVGFVQYYGVIVLLT